MRLRSWRTAGTAIALVAASAVLSVSSPGHEANASVPPHAAKLLLFASDGMRPDLMEKYASLGLMPTYKTLMRTGVHGDNGMVQAFPPNTGVGWYTIATGTYPSEHGSTNNTFFRSGDKFTNRTSFSASGVLQADTLAAAAERAGKKVAQVEWTGGINAGIQGPTVDFATSYSRGGVLVGKPEASESAGAASFGLPYQVGTWVPASGWSNVPAGDPAAPPMEISGGWSIPSSFSSQNPNRRYNVYAYDSRNDGKASYNHVIIVPGLLPSGSKDGSTAGAIDLAVGDFKAVRLTGSLGLTGSRAGESAGHYIKLISLRPDLSDFKLYMTAIERPQARCGTAACAALPAGVAGEDRLEKYIADNLPVWSGADFAPLEAGIIDEDTYVQQGRDLEAGYGDAVLKYVLGTLQPDTDLALVGYPFTDEVSHQFMGLVTPTGIDGTPNPCYDITPKFDDVTCTGAGTAGRVGIREGYIRSAYHAADSKLAVARSLLGGNPTTFAASDHGFAPQWFAVNAQKVLHDTTVNGVALHASDAAANCAATTTDLAKACWAGGTIQVYVNSALPAGTTYEDVRTAVVTAFQHLTDPARPAATVVAKVLKKEQLRNVDGSDSLSPNRSGDVVVVLRPPYQADSGTDGQTIALSHFFGQHGFLPNLVDLAHNVNMHATFVAAGPGVRHQDMPVAGIRAIDVAPTAAFLLGVPGPQNARGSILTSITTKPALKVWTVLDISDFHGQLIPLSDAPDTIGPSFAIGGAAFLKPWLDSYRAQAPNGSITIAGGDSVGATPPISGFFGDKPTIAEMNKMGFSADGIGNHNFDRGQAYLRNTLIPLANFPYVSANVVDANGNTPPQWSPSHVFAGTFDGGKLGLIGVTDDDLADLITPGNLTPFHVTNSTAAVNAEAARLRAQGVRTIVTIAHLGATAGTLTAPTGPLVDLADHVTGVNAVIGDHSDFQVDTVRPNGVLVTENRSKGIRFTRMQLVIDPGTKAVVYMTADFHKPWDIGVTPDPGIQADIDALNAQLAPVMNQKVGDSTKFIPRADQCGNSAGRTCESLVGNVVADSMRAKYASIGVQFAITNAGGLRSDLTCPAGPADPDPSDFCPASLYPIPTGAGLFPITRGQVLTELPFGNVVSTVTISGAELKQFLENGVSQLPAIAGRFPQVSGLCFSYDIAAPPFSRITSVVTADASGNCTSTPVDLTASASYKIAENDFMASGGDGYPATTGLPGYATQDLMDQVLADYLTASDPVSPVVTAAPGGRINCTDSNGAGTAPDCPALTPSP